jgi:hypothetical protein
MHSAIDQLNTDVNEQFNQLDQTVKDLLQFVCIINLFFMISLADQK